MRELSVNVDHVATLRQAREAGFPDPADAALEAEAGGADGITCHLRSDRRHIQEEDVKRLKDSIRGELNVEMAATDEMCSVVIPVAPVQITLVPESPEEVTTQGGLDLASGFDSIKPHAERITSAGIRLSLFIEAREEMVRLAKKLGAARVEFNTDPYAVNPQRREELLERYAEIARFASSEGIESHVGHALDYDNLPPLMRIPEIKGASIGFAIIARALKVGLRKATAEMARLVGKEVVSDD